MALNAGAVIAKFQADLSNFKDGINNAKNAMGDLKSGFSKSTDSIASDISSIETKAVIMGTAVVGALALIGRQAINSASDMEQARIAFTTMFGSAEKASKLMKEISDFAVKTPFELPQLVEGAKRLSAYGVSAEQMIPTLKTLGDITAGVGTDKLPQLILAFGQVKAATKLTGAELRQFTEAGVPMLDELAKHFNETGKTISVGMGGATKKTKVDVAELNDKLAIASQRLKEAEGNAKTKQSTLMSLRNTVQNYQQKIASATGTVGKFSGSMVKAKVTAGDVKKMIEDGQVTFEDVQASLTQMTTKGGKFFDLMDAQSKTFGGVMSNIRDQIGRTLRTMVGMDDAGNIAENSIFAKVKQLAETFLAWLTANTPAFTAFFQNLVKSIGDFASSQPVVDFFNGFIAVLTVIANWVKDNQELVLGFIKGLAIALGALVIIGAIIGLINLLFNPITWIVLAITALYLAWQTNFLGMRDIVDAVVKFVMAFFEGLKNYWAEWGGVITNFFTDFWNLVKGIWQVATGLLMMILGVFIGLFTGDWKKAGEVIKNGAKQAWDGVVNIISGAFGLIMDGVHAFFKQFTDKLDELWNKAREVGGKIKDALMQMNPFHKNSPSLVELVQKGTQIIQRTYEDLADNVGNLDLKSGIMSATGGDLASMLANGAGQGGTTVNQNINMNVKDRNDAEFINGRLAFIYRNSNL